LVGRALICCAAAGLAAVAAVAAAAAPAQRANAQECVCERGPIEERLDRADAAILGRVVSEAFPDLDDSAPTRLLGIDVEQRVKGDVEDETAGDDRRRIFVRTPHGTKCDLEIDRDTTLGLLLTRTADGWFASSCSRVAPGPLVAAGGEPRGGAIKVVIGLAILGIVLSWAIRRRQRGVRPHLPRRP
jgi:hypothetical protein